MEKDSNNKQIYNILLHKNHYRKCNKINMMDIVKFKKNNKYFDKTFDFHYYKDLKMNKSNFYKDMNVH